MTSSAFLQDSGSSPSVWRRCQPGTAACNPDDSSAAIASSPFLVGILEASQVVHTASRLQCCAATSRWCARAQAKASAIAASRIARAAKAASRNKPAWCRATARCALGFGWSRARLPAPRLAFPTVHLNTLKLLQAVQRAVRLVEEQEARRGGGSGVRPVDPREAARGKVEYVKVGAGQQVILYYVQNEILSAVQKARSGKHAAAVPSAGRSPPAATCAALHVLQVKDWGSGQPEDLGSLQVKENATRVFEQTNGDASSSSNASSSSSDSGSAASQGMPFHETLARRLQLLQSQGALGGLAQVGAAVHAVVGSWPFGSWGIRLAATIAMAADCHPACSSLLSLLQHCLRAAAGRQAAAAV